ncbi:hypothetical protein Airi01_049240 [Actinoallomurus iriomotensis]|uniref:tRNAHis guanylyltransferase catalytic domain-containing protein n=1 Tax=Actinoallomurus iriomotensis TaxID=478107 RepID=A0A9W6VRM6_9ACTN|nr:hypothetical protein Airi01_049240 [Actinoallomurus iriomotensis]
MKGKDLENRMRSLEWFHSLAVLPGAWTIIRVDGRGFSRFTVPRPPSRTPWAKPSTSTVACGWAPPRKTSSTTSPGGRPTRRAARG